MNRHPAYYLLVAVFGLVHELFQTLQQIVYINDDGTNILT